jgi:tRNA G18 (ribose-2'-O)-methylase SpoU
MEIDREIVTENQLKSEMNNWNVRDDLKGLSVEEIRKKQPRLGFAVGLVTIDGGLNIGSMIRTATIFGANKVFTIGPSKRYDKRSTVGAHNYIDIEHIECEPDDVEAIRKVILFTNYYVPICIEQTPDSMPIHSSAFRSVRNPCFLFGSEGKGLPQSLIDPHLSAEIPQPGVMRSLNVSAAAAIAIYEWSKWRL